MSLVFQYREIPVLKKQSPCGAETNSQTRSHMPLNCEPCPKGLRPFWLSVSPDNQKNLSLLRVLRASVVRIKNLKNVQQDSTIVQRYSLHSGTPLHICSKSILPPHQARKIFPTILFSYQQNNTPFKTWYRHCYIKRYLWFI